MNRNRNKKENKNMNKKRIRIKNCPKIIINNYKLTEKNMNVK